MKLEILLTVLTLNVAQTGHHGRERYAAIEAGLQALQADVVTLQEVRRRGKKGTSADGLLKGYHRVVDGRWRGYHLAVLSKHPIKRSFRIPFRNNRARMALAAVIDVRGTEVLVVTTHLNYKLKDHRARRKQLEAIFARVEDFPGPVILTGDMNFGDGEPENAIIPKAYTDVWRALRPKDKGLTWNNEDNPLARRGKLRGEPSRRLDRIFTRGMRPKDVKLVFDKPIRKGLFPSDHYGVMASFGGKP